MGKKFLASRRALSGLNSMANMREQKVSVICVSKESLRLKRQEMDRKNNVLVINVKELYF